ncbi:TetR family transcriptional regulator [Pseudarthrobacter sulfonivorans]|uniref:TetR family transcriptional regulator n=1 Tax=Pseudarthrobacter sulfonivorans TaxID=121292 RepID=UPI00286D35FE|nr:TetR family transcriptional regulator [Pseudarthrobacter sulfonivorans]
MPSLCERNRVETWTAVHEPRSLAQRRGLEQATVEVITEGAGVSPRTYLKYFPAKEDAVLGLREPVLDPAECANPTSAANLLDQMTLLLASVARSALGGHRYAPAPRTAAAVPEPVPPPDGIHGQRRSTGL